MTKGLPILPMLLVVFAATPLSARGEVTVEWVEPTRGVSIAADSADNLYTVDYVYNPAGDIILTKRAADGGFLWESTFDQTDNSKWEKATWVATDSEGNAIVTGTLMSGYANPVNAASIVMKFAPDGELLWRSVYENGFDGSYTKKCLVDENDDIYVLGMGSGPSGFVTKVKKFAADGSAIWTAFDDAGIGAPVNFKFAPGGDLVIACRAIFGSINGYARIDRDGGTIWSLPGVNSLTVGDADGDSFGNTYVVHGEYVMNGGTVLVKLSPSGQPIWSNVYDLAAFRVEVGADDRPVICGFPDANSPGSSFTKVDEDGNVVWANPDADGPYNLMLHAQVLMDAADNVYLAAGTLTEMAVCKVTRDGASDWTATTTGSYANAIALGNTDNSVYVVGGATARLRQESAAGVPAGLAHRERRLAPVAPNPCGAAAVIRYSLPAEAAVTLQVLDAAGRVAGDLANGVDGPGERSVRFDAGRLAAGTYTVRLSHGSLVETRKMTVVK